jgi:hypothetical protein
VAKLNEATCPSTANCANENFADSCWNTVATGHTADTAGQFRVVLKYSGGCQYLYFNVYKNTLNPTVLPMILFVPPLVELQLVVFHLDMSTV